MASPDLLAVDAVAALDLAVLLRPARLDVAVPHAGSLYSQLKRQWKLGPVVALNLTDRERERVGQLPEKLETRVMVLAREQPQHPHARGVVQGGVLKHPLLRQLDDLHVDLDGVTRVLLLEEFHLSRPPPWRLHQDRHADIAKHALNRPGVDLQLVDALEPHARARRAPLMLDPRHPNQLNRRRG